jgi:GTPase Era involved in 16S rRNA processing
MSDVPAIAFVGHVNPGKTSAIATLLEEDGLRISAVPGETTECQRFDLKGPDGKTLIVFYDTPGFQNAPSTLLRLQELAPGASSPLDLFRNFVAKFAKELQYENECKLFGPIIDGAGIVYVVDAAEPLRPIHEAEMKIIQMAGRPVLGLINWTDDPVHEQTWENVLRQHSFTPWKFNTHNSALADRISLIKRLPTEQQSARALDRAAAALDADWRQRIHDCAAKVSELLIESLQHKETRTVSEPNEENKRELEKKYKNYIRKSEREAHEEILRVFKHNKATIAKVGFEGEWDLFSEFSWTLIGLSRLQLIASAAAAGAAAGATIEVGMLGHGLGIPTALGTLIGGATGGTAAYYGGDVVAKVETPTWLGYLAGRKTLGGTKIVVGPDKHPNFPFGLIDRAMAVYVFAIQRAHARQDKPAIDPQELLDSGKVEKYLTKNWDTDSRKKCDEVFSKARKGISEPKDRECLTGVLVKWLEAAGA